MEPVPPWLATQAKLNGVTSRELDVLAGLLTNLSNPEIATELYISVRTVESHVSSLLSKFGVSNRGDLVKLLEDLQPARQFNPPMPRPLTRQARADRFLGRLSELQLLREDWAQCLQGAEQLSVICGEAGIGKSRLAAQFASEVFEAGATVLYGSFHEDIAAPYEAIAEAVTPYLLEIPASDLQASLGTLVDDLALIVPSLKQHHAVTHADRMVDGGVGFHRLIEAVRTVLQRLTATRPVLLILDDLHWASRPALVLLRNLLIRGDLGRLHVLLTHRDAEPGSDLSSFSNDIHRGMKPTRIEMSGLNAADSLALIRSVEGDTGDKSIDSRWFRLFAETRGNPFFLAEAARSDSGSGKSAAADDLVPLGIDGLVSRRVRELGSAGRAMIEMAAVLGNEFDVRCLARVADSAENDVISVMERATALGLVYDIGDAPAAAVRENADHYNFAHAIVRRAILSHVSVPRRSRIHSAAAAALQAEAVGGDDRADEIARHTIEAGVASTPEQVPFLIMAGRSALASGAFQDAYDFFDEARHYDLRADASTWSELTFQMGVALRGLGRWDDALECWRESLNASGQSGDIHSVARTCEAASYNLMWAIRTQEAVELAEYGVGLLREVEGPELGRLLGTLAIAQAWSGRYVESSESVTAEQSLAARLEDGALEAHARGAATLQLTAFSEHTRAVQNAQAAVRGLRDAGDSWMLSSLLGYQQFAMVGLGRIDEARALRNDIQVLANRVGNYGALLQETRIDALLDFYEFGDSSAFAAFANGDLEFCRVVGSGLETMSHAWLGLARFCSGDWSAAITHLEEAARLERPSAMTGWSLGLLFEVRAYAGSRDSALTMLGQHNSLLPVRRRANSCGSWFWMLAATEGLFVLGEHGQAAAFYDTIVEFSQRTGVVCIEWVDGRIVERVAGIAAMAAEKWDLAEQHFMSALQIAEGLPHIVEAIHTRRYLGTMLLSRGSVGDVDRAKDYLAAAQSSYERLGMSEHARICRDVSRQA